MSATASSRGLLSLRSALQRFVVAVASLPFLAACASQPMPPPGQDKGLDRAIAQPFRDLSLIRDIAPEALQRAAAGPYDIALLETCAATQAEVADLDAALGPDIGPAGKAAGLTVQGLANDLVGGAIGLPFRGIVRHVTGAEQREQALRAAVLAGMVRRGFLKGRMTMMASCPPPSPPAQQAHAAAERG